MTPEEIAVARELVAHPNFVWMHAMLQARVKPDREWEYRRCEGTYAISLGRVGYSEWMPWLPDPATKGGLLELARIRWAQPDLYVMREGDTWGVHYPAGSYGHDSSETVADLWEEPSEVIALARAILAFPTD